MINYFLFLLLAAAWGGSFIAIKYVLVGLPPLMGAALRLVIALSTIGVLFITLRKPLTLPRHVVWKAWLTGLFTQAFPFALVFWGEQSIPAGLAGILNGTVPLWTLLISLLCFRRQETVTTKKTTGLLLGLVGVALIFAPALRGGNAQYNLFGTLAVLGMAISYAIGITLNRYLLAGERQINFYANLFQQHCASCAFLLLIAYVTTPPAQFTLLGASFPTLLASAYLGIVSTALGWIAFYHLIQTWGAIRASSVTYLVPAIALLFDLLWFHQSPTLLEGIGAAIVLGSVLLIQRAKSA